MKSILFTLCGVFMTMNTFSQIDSVFYYNPNGTKNWWHVQQDVISFHCTNNGQYSGNFNPNHVINQLFWSQDSRKMNEVHLSPTCLPGNVAQVIGQIQSSPNFELFSYAITKTPNVPCDLNEYYTTDDQILVLFHNTPSQSNIQYLEQQYDLEIIHTPSSSLPSQGNYTYVFKVHIQKDQLSTPFEVSQEIFENESNLIYAVKPNVYYRGAELCVSENVLDPSGSKGTWYINNDGGIVWNNTNGTNDADVDACECWAAGYTGSGIKVGVIDVASLEFNHPDLATVTKAYDISQTPPAEQFSNFTLDANLGHSMNVMGVIGATPDNTSLGQRYAVGVAYNADLYAYIAPSINEADITRGLQQALQDNVDIVNMSFKLGPNVFMDAEIQNLVSFGRADVNAPNGAWGTLILAGSGNVDLNVSHYPASNVNVMGIGGSNPRDYRWSGNPPDGEGWTSNPGQGSSFGPPDFDYDVVAPSEVIMTTDAVNYGQQGNYTVTIGTSFSTPITAGVAAILLEKNPAQTYQELRQVIRDGAEKVHPTIYDYNEFPTAPGYSLEMFYGRVSCINSLNLVTVSVQEQEAIKDLAIMNLGDNHYQIVLPENYSGGELNVFSTSGSLLINAESTDGSPFIDVNLSNLASGVYVLVLHDSDKVIGMSKIIK